MQRMWVGGQWTGSVSKKTFPIDNPATEEIIDEVPRAGAKDADLAVESAAEAFGVWRGVPGTERAALMHDFATRLRGKAMAVARRLTLEGGKPLIENLDEVEWCAACFDYYGELARDQGGRVPSPVFRHQINFVRKEPYGVVVAIVPWNYPLLLLTWKLAPALAAGNTVVVKPSEYTPLSTLLMAERALQHLPPGVVNIVTGYGPEVGEPLVTHPQTDVVAFTGSVATGRRINMLAAERLKKTHLELGGNDPLIVCDDVDLDVAVRGSVWAAYLNMGQVCTSGERFYVFESVARKFIDRFVDFTRSLRIGNPMGPDVDLGPMISATQREKVEAKLEQSRRLGAQVLCGGKRPERLSRGYYFEPTVVTEVNHSMPLMREETFGPIAPIMVVRDIEEAVQLANDSQYGLGANILTNSLEYALTAAERIKAGTFWINDPLTDNDAGPFGGMRLSGIGRELGSEGLEAFRDTKHIHMDYKLEAKPYWYPYDWSKCRKTD